MAFVHQLSSIVPVLLGLLLAAPGPSQRRSGDSSHADQPRVNRCGCYQDGLGVCKCLRKSVCGCPGECEPLGCEEKRQKDLARRMEEELEKIREDQQKRKQPRPEQAGETTGSADPADGGR
jgi:hypothetical protein